MAKNKTTQEPLHSQPVIPVEVVDYVDTEGIHRRVKLPANQAHNDPSEGIPLSLDLSDYFEGATPAFIARVQNELWAVGLIEPTDYLKAGAGEKIKAALLSALKIDTIGVQAYARERLK